MALVGGIALALLVAIVWHGPLGAGQRLSHNAETVARITLDYYEMTGVDARLARGPLTRTLVLSGPADDFQRGELVRIMKDVPGVGDVRWRDSPPAAVSVPLLVEAELLTLAGFGLGLMLSYLLELRRRARAEWRW